MWVFRRKVCKGSEVEGEMLRGASAGWEERFVVCDEEGDFVGKTLPAHRETESRGCQGAQKPPGPD